MVEQSNRRRSGGSTCTCKGKSVLVFGVGPWIKMRTPRSPLSYGGFRLYTYRERSARKHVLHPDCSSVILVICPLEPKPSNMACSPPANPKSFNLDDSTCSQGRWAMTTASWSRAWKAFSSTCRLPFFG